MAKFQMNVVLNPEENITARVADGSGASNQLTRVDAGKFGKLAGDSQYGLCAVGDKIEGVIVTADDLAPQDGFNLGSVQLGARVKVTLDGSEAAGSGTIAVGDYVVAGTVVARGTALSGAPKVRKATNQPGTAVTSADNVVGNINAALAKMADAQKNVLWGWRVVSILAGGTGAVGDTAVIERVSGD